MSCINNNTDDRNAIMVGNTGVTVPSKMMNSSKILDPIVERLINLVEDVDEDTLNGVIATTFCQQGITTFEHLCNFPYYAEFYGRFTYYKEKDADVNTTNGNDLAIPDNVLISIHWLLLWCIHRKEDKNDPESNNPSVWTHDEIIDFARRNKKSRNDPGYVGYDEYINNKNKCTTNNNNDAVLQSNKNASSGLLKQSFEHVRNKKKDEYEYSSLVNDSTNKKKLVDHFSI